MVVVVEETRRQDKTATRQASSLLGGEDRFRAGLGLVSWQFNSPSDWAHEDLELHPNSIQAMIHADTPALHISCSTAAIPSGPTRSPRARECACRLYKYTIQESEPPAAALYIHTSSMALLAGPVHTVIDTGHPAR